VNNWEILKLKKDEVIKYVLACLIADRKKILKRGFNDTFSVSVGDRFYVINNKGLVKS
jgi:hypothetical protein